MKNLGTLYFYELRKLLAKRMAWVTTFLLTALMVYTACSPPSTAYGSTFTLTDREGHTISQYLSMAEQSKINREGDLPIRGLPMDGEFFRQVRELPLFSGAYVLTDRSTVHSYFMVVDPRFSWACSMIEDIPDLDAATVTAEGFYVSRQQLLERVWQMEGLSEQDTAYWQAMEAKVPKPFVYQNIWGSRDMLDARPAFLAEVIPLAAAVFLCGVFAEDKRTRTDMLIFSSRYGWFPLYLAKVLAGCTAVLAGCGMIMGAVSAVISLTRSMSGLEAAIQLRCLKSSLPITLGQAILILWGLLLLYSLLCGGVTMLISALTKNSTAALVVPALLVLIQMLRIPAPEWITGYMPNCMFDSMSILSDVHLVHILGMTFNKLQFGYLLYGLLTVLLLALCWLGWRRSAIGRA